MLYKSLSHYNSNLISICLSCYAWLFTFYDLSVDSFLSVNSMYISLTRWLLSLRQKIERFRGLKRYFLLYSIHFQHCIFKTTIYERIQLSVACKYWNWQPGHVVVWMPPMSIWGVKFTEWDPTTETITIFRVVKEWKYKD